jgi:predicted transcriptional regulator
LRLHPNKKLAALVVRALSAARLSHVQAAPVLGVSPRTISRYVSGQSAPTSAVLEGLARMVAPLNSAIAGELASAAGVNLPTKTEDAARFVEVVICAMASAMNVSPNIVRPGILAAYESATELGLSFDTIATVLKQRRPA